MAWYREADYESIPAYNRSFIVALSNLIKHLDAGDYPPDILSNLLTSDDPYLDWLVLPEYVKTITLGEVHDDDPQWPVQNGAIVKFRRIDFESGNELDHYCLVIDARQMAIVDSLDGIIKHGASYGQVYSWATYTLTPKTAQDEIDVAIKERRSYILAKGENLWDAARHLNQKVAVLMEYNGIGDPRKVKEGFKLDVPPVEYIEKKVVEYRLFDEPLTMKVIKSGGAQKYAFGNADRWSDIHAVGRVYPEGSPHIIVGEARVFLDKEEEDTEAAYYMERLDMGRYRDTGLVAFSTGYNHSHLALASETFETVNETLEIVAPAVEPVEQPQTRLHTVVEINEPAVVEQVEEVLEAEEHIIEPALTLDEQIEEQLGPQFDTKPTVTPINEDVSPVNYIVTEDIYVHELANKRAPVRLKENQMIQLTYTIEVRDLLYGVNGLAYERGLTFLIPMNKVYAEDELFSTDMTTSEKIAARVRLTGDERVFAFMSKILSSSVSVKSWLNSRKK